jgi:glutathione S-transferase
MLNLTTLMMQRVLARGGEGNPMAAFVADRSQRGWAMVEKRLCEAPLFGGAELTTANIMMVYGLTTSRAFRGTSIDAYPSLKAYLKHIGARPAYQRATAKAEPGMTPMLAKRTPTGDPGRPNAGRCDARFAVLLARWQPCASASPDGAANPA